MIGSPAIAAWIAPLVFWALLPVGVLAAELRPRTAVVFVVLWSAGYVGLPYLGTLGALFVTPYVALLDILLVLAIFKGDVTLT